jgi:hypothetical protein
LHGCWRASVSKPPSPRSNGAHQCSPGRVSIEVVAAKLDAARISSKGQLEIRAAGLERNCALDIPRAENLVRFFED